MIPEHYKSREQTFIKHTILRRYLERLFMIKGQFEPVICYIDCFAGPWQEDSGQMHDTSIAISLKIMKDCQAALEEMGKKVQFAALYIEKNQGAYDKLEDFLQHDDWSSIETKALHGDFFNLRNAICDWCNNDSFAFFFLDPTGWKDVVEIETLRPLLQRKKSEYLINFMFEGGIHSSLVRLVGDEICLQSYLRRALDQFAAPVPVNDKRAILVILRCAG